MANDPILEASLIVRSERAHKQLSETPVLPVASVLVGYQKHRAIISFSVSCDEPRCGGHMFAFQMPLGLLAAVHKSAGDILDRARKDGDLIEDVTVIAKNE